MDNKETRSLPLPSDGENRNVKGYAANFKEYDMGSFRERIDRSPHCDSRAFVPGHGLPERVTHPWFLLGQFGTDQADNSTS